MLDEHVNGFVSQKRSLIVLLADSAQPIGAIVIIADNGTPCVHIHYVVLLCVCTGMCLKVQTFYLGIVHVTADSARSKCCSIKQSESEGG